MQQVTHPIANTPKLENFYFIQTMLPYRKIHVNYSDKFEDVKLMKSSHKCDYYKCSIRLNKDNTNH